MTSLINALREKFSSPQQALQALGLDAALLDQKPNPSDFKDSPMQTSRIALDEKLRRPEVLAALRDAELGLRRQRGRYAMDAADDLRDVLEELAGEGRGGPRAAEAVEHGGIKTNLGLPTAAEIYESEEAGMDERDDDDKEEKEEEEEEEEEREEREAHDRRRRRAEDARKRLGRDESAEERKEREEREEREEAQDRRRRRAEDVRKRLGRDESEEEREEREDHERAHDVARDSIRHMRGLYRQAKDALDQARHRRRAMDFRHRMGRDWSKEEEAEDRKHRDAEDRRRRDADDRRRDDAEDRGRRDAEDRLVSRRGGGMKPVTDSRRRDAEDRRHAMDEATVNALVERRVLAALENKDAIYAARDKVRPLVGELAMDSVTSPADIFRQALEMRGIATSGIHPSAYETLLNMELSRPQTPSFRMATDSGSGGRSFADLFPNAGSVRRI